MTAMTTTALPAGEWTDVYTAAGAITITLQNLSACDVKLRIGASVATSDALTAAHDMIFPREIRSIVLATGDKIIACPINDSIAGKVNVRA